MNAPLLTGINLGVLWTLIIIRIILTGNGEIARKHATQVEFSKLIPNGLEKLYSKSISHENKFQIFGGI